VAAVALHIQVVLVVRVAQAVAVRGQLQVVLLVALVL
jgi:hypothetical protein